MPMRCRVDAFVFAAVALVTTALLASAQGRDGKAPQKKVDVGKMGLDVLVQPARTLSLDVRPGAGTVNSPVALEATVNPAGNLPWQYTFYANGSQAVEGCAAASAQCYWTPTMPGEHTLHVTAWSPSLPPDAPGGRDQPLVFGRIPFIASPAPPPPEPLPVPPIAPGTNATEPTAPAAATPAPIAFIVQAVPQVATAGETVTLSIATADGRPLPAYRFDRGDGSPGTFSESPTQVVTYERPGAYTVSIVPLEGMAGAGASTSISVNAAPPTWLYVVIGVVALGGAAAAGRLLHRRVKVPSATFHPSVDFEPHFDPPRTSGVSLRVHYHRRLDSLRFSPPERINPEV